MTGGFRGCDHLRAVFCLESMNQLWSPLLLSMQGEEQLHKALVPQPTGGELKHKEVQLFAILPS